MDSVRQMRERAQRAKARREKQDDASKKANEKPADGFKSVDATKDANEEPADAAKKPAAIDNANEQLVDASKSADATEDANEKPADAAEMPAATGNASKQSDDSVKQRRRKLKVFRDTMRQSLPAHFPFLSVNADKPVNVAMGSAPAKDPAPAKGPAPVHSTTTSVPGNLFDTNNAKESHENILCDQVMDSDGENTAKPYKSIFGDPDETDEHAHHRPEMSTKIPTWLSQAANIDLGSSDDDDETSYIESDDDAELFSIDEEGNNILDKTAQYNAAQDYQDQGDPVSNYKKYASANDCFLRRFVGRCEEGIKNPELGPQLTDLLSAMSNQYSLHEKDLHPMWFVFKEKHPAIAARLIEDAQSFMTPYGEPFRLLPPHNKAPGRKRWIFWNPDYVFGVIPPQFRIGAPKKANWFKRELWLGWSREDIFSHLTELDVLRDGLITSALSKGRMTKKARLPDNVDGDNFQPAKTNNEKNAKKKEANDIKAASLRAATALDPDALGSEASDTDATSVPATSVPPTVGPAIVGPAIVAAATAAPVTIATMTVPVAKKAAGKKRSASASSSGSAPFRKRGKK